MKRRFANAVEGIYTQKRVDKEIFKGYLCNIKLQNIKNPLIVNNGVADVCIKDNNYEWFELYPDNGNYALTIMFDDKDNLIEWYFDIAKEIGLENNIPYEDDLYLDMVVLPNGMRLVLDEEELLTAFRNGDIKREDVELANKTLKFLEENYVKDFQRLTDLTEFVCREFKGCFKEIL